MDHSPASPIPRLASACAVLLFAGGAAAEPPAALSTARQVAESYLLPEPRPPVDLKAVVTGTFPSGTVLLRDETGVTFVRHPCRGEPVQAGDRVRAPADVVVVRAARWWTATRLAWALGGTAVAAAAMLGWVLLLRRQVGDQSRELAATLRSQHDAAIEFETALRERNRLAANLHDTVLQTVTGIGYQLQPVQAIGSRDGGVDAGRLVVAGQPGPARGHFGIEAMMDRMQAVGGRFRTLTGSNSATGSMQIQAARSSSPRRCRSSPAARPRGQKRTSSRLLPALPRSAWAWAEPTA